MQQIALEKESATSVRTHNYGVDSMKIASMFMVVVLHVLGQGGILQTAAVGTINYYLAWTLEIAAFCAVNCFALTSGYLSIDREIRYSKLILLWLQVAVYSVGITFLFWLVRPDTVSFSQAIHSFFPVLSASYWYFTAYFGLFFFTPFINKLFHCLSKAELNRLLITIFLLLSVLPLFTQKNLFELSKGYSMTWLCALYIIGAYLKTYQVLPRLRTGNFGLYLLMIGIVCFSRFVLEAISPVLGLEPFYTLLFVSYTSPFILLAAVFLFLFFSRLQFKATWSKHIVGFFAPISFGVYLIHTHPFVWNHLLIDRFARYATLSPLFMLGSILLTATLIFISCALLDFLRNQLFLLFRIPRLTQYLERQCAKAVSSLRTSEKPES